MEKTAKIRDLKVRLLEVSKITNPERPKEKDEEDRLLERLIVISTDSTDGKLLNDGAKRIVYYIWKSCIQPLEKYYICHKFGKFSSTKVDCNM